MEGEAGRASKGDTSPAQDARAGELGTEKGPTPPARMGTYRPRIEAWHEGDAEEDRPKLEPEGEAGDGRPWSGRPDPTAGSPEPDSLSQTHLPPPPALAPPAPIGPVDIPNLPREERGVPPVAAPSRESIGSAVRRPMFETDPHPDSRASRPPEPVPAVPPEESSPLTVPIKWNVELDEPEAYLPLRFDSESARVLPTAPVSFAGGQGGLTLESAGSVSVPALEPTGLETGAAIRSDVRSPMVPPGSDAPMSARQRKAADKAAKKGNERRGKPAKKVKGTASPPPPSPAPSSSDASSDPPSDPPTASSEGWKLEDVLNLGPKKRGS